MKKPRKKQWSPLGRYYKGYKIFCKCNSRWPLEKDLQDMLQCVLIMGNCPVCSYYPWTVK
jgi:hypothetical protein